MKSLAASILAVLPQTQCTRCGYPDCAAYAQAIAQGQAPINHCPPGGTQGIERLARVTGQPVLPLDPAKGAQAPRSVAYIDEDWCIGCTLCLKACPVDAIMGSNKLMHTVLEAYCTGCELCLPVCPVDCIELENASGSATGWHAWSQTQADVARSRYEFKALHARAALPETRSLQLDRKQILIEAALQRARAARATSTLPAQG